MQPKLKRSELDGLAEFYSLDVQRTETLLELADARPSRTEGLRFLATCLRIAGVLSLAAGLVFFVAANWSEIAVFGRFALIQLVLVACVVVAWIKPPPDVHRPRRCVPCLHRHRRIARALRPDLSNRRGRLRAVPHLGVVRPAIGGRRSVERGVGGLGAGAQHRAAAVLRLASHGWTAVGDLRRRALPARAYHPLRRLAQSRCCGLRSNSAPSMRCRTGCAACSCRAPSVSPPGVVCSASWAATSCSAPRRSIRSPCWFSPPP